MQRNTIQKDKRAGFDSLLTDQQSLLFKLCDQLLISGFVFEDSTANEIEAGGDVIKNFFDQENQVLRKLVSSERLNEFVNYLERFEWSEETLEIKLCQRIKKAFDQLAKGTHHHYNILYNISQGLRQIKGHPLSDLLLYIEAYYILVLGGESPNQKLDKEQNCNKKYFNIDDLIQYRKQIRERLEGRVLVKSFLSHIAKLRGETVEKLIITEEKSSESLLVDYSGGTIDVNQKILNEEDNNLIKKTDSNISAQYDAEFESEEDIEFDVDKVHSMQHSGSDDTDVVFGSDIIRAPSMEKFLLQYPESALKFLMRQNIDGKPLPYDIVLVHAGWEERGLSRNVLKKYLLELMQWSDFPDLPFQDFYQQIRNRIFEVSRR
ncbi:MAG: hypothetical protein CM1200mP28_14810 [Deltaproteobacteria bacterium]|nr:MAG: hypothetical protein CM1200mP28_14810 [Deltaproteobacteria bacterium]